MCRSPLLALWGMLGLLMFAGCATAPRQPSRIQRSTPSAQAIADHLQLWMDPAAARQVVKTMRPDARPGDQEVNYGSYTEVRYATGDNEFLALRFNTLRDPNGPLREQLTVITAAHFNDLKTAANAEVFSALSLIHRAPAPEGFQFNPLTLIQAVNGLWPLGKDKAMQSLRAYDALCRSSDRERQFRYDLDQQRIFLITRLLFIRTDHNPRMPRMLIGGTDLDSLLDDPHWPVFPLAVQDDVPFFLVPGYNLGGVPQAAADHLDFCAANCELRPQPLSPRTSPPLAAESLLKSNSLQAPYTLPLIHDQAIRAVEDLLPESHADFYQDPDAAARYWNQTLARLKRWPAQWNPADQRFY